MPNHKDAVCRAAKEAHRGPFNRQLIQEKMMEPDVEEDKEDNTDKHYRCTFTLQNPAACKMALMKSIANNQVKVFSDSSTVWTVFVEHQ